MKLIAAPAGFTWATCLFGLYLCIAMAWPTAYAGTAASAESKPEVLAQIPTARAGGKGLLRFWGFEVYNASLWVAPSFKPAELGEHPIALELEYLRKFGSEEIARVSLEEMRRSGGFSEAQGQHWQSTLAKMLPPVKPGDRLLGVYRPGVGAAFVFNGKPIGEIADAQFGKLFFEIWLGPKTSQPKLRDLLLAGVK